MGKKGKAQTRKRVGAKDLTPRDAKQVKGGRAGGDKLKYMEVKLNDILISG